MAAQQPERSKEGITRITVGGFKSINQERSIKVRPLTILAGANSSGKSSIMQPLLLLKQTLEANYDPGALLLNGPNVKFTSVDQLLSHKGSGGAVETLNIAIEVNKNVFVRISLKKSKNKGFEVDETTYKIDNREYHLYTEMTEEEFQIAANTAFSTIARSLPPFVDLPNIAISDTAIRWSKIFISNRCFLLPSLLPQSEYIQKTMPESSFYVSITEMPGEIAVIENIRKLIHLPGLRGNPERTYPVTAVGTMFPGTFENYVASIISRWQREGGASELREVTRDLLKLGLTNKISARAIDDTQVELLVSRFPYHSKISKDDMVSIADVGLGVSQALPVVVALHVANKDQLIYLEQPEIHLHPRAQTAMAEVLADAVLEGKRVVVETHSSLLLLGIQTLVAEGKLPKEMVKLHWFTQQEDGSTTIDSADLDETGAFGDWPEDFDTVSLDAESRYIDAAHNRLKGN